MDKRMLGDLIISYNNKRKALNNVERNKKKEGKLYPYYGANGVVDYINEYMIEDEVLCIAEDGGSWGKNEKCSYIVSGKFWVNNHAHVVKTKKELDMRYLMYFLNFENLNRYITGTTRGKLTKNSLEKIKISIPSFNKQKEIVRNLEKIKKIIELKKIQLLEIENLKKSQFFELFGDPIKNEKGWENYKLNEIYEIIDGDRGKNYPKSSDFSNKGFCLFLNAKNVTKEGFKFEETNYISQEKDKSMGKGKLERGDIVLTTRGTLGNLAIYGEKIKYPNIRINSGMVILRKIDKTLEDKYFIEYLKNSRIIEKIKSGTAQPQMPILHLKKIKISVPPIILQNKFATRIEAIQKLKFRKLKSLEKTENSKIIQKFLALK